jgi:hypothetical protein
MQYHPYQTQSSASKLAACFILVIGYKIVHFNPQLIKKTSNLFNLAPYLINFNPCIHTPFSIWSSILEFFNQVPNCSLNFNIYAIKP